VPLSPNRKCDKYQLAKLALQASRPLLAEGRSSTFTSKDLYRPAKIATNFKAKQEDGKQVNTLVIISSSLSEFNVSATSIAKKPVTLLLKNGFYSQR
jgi:hypothetical protein